MRSIALGLIFLGACGGEQANTSAAIVLCPAGSMLDPSTNQCAAIEPTKPVVVAETVAVPTPIAPTPIVSVAVTATVAVPPPPPPPPPPTSGFAVDVRCTFPQGWVALLPAAKYPKDDQFLMQSLIGLTKDPHFWSGLPEYRPLQPFAATRCNATTTTRLSAPTAGDYFLLGGQEGTFALRGTYDKNGVRRKMTINGSSTVTLSATDLTMTWVCISCPWIVFPNVAPFVVLANRNARDRRGTDVHRVNHVAVNGGKIVLRVMEVEEEITHLDRLTLRIAGTTDALIPSASVIARDDGREVQLNPHTEVTITYAAPIIDGFVDIDVEATGYYDPL